MYLQVVFVLDEFDVFAQVAKKTLYNIFDVMHSNQCVMAIIGQTTRMVRAAMCSKNHGMFDQACMLKDATDLLEKRMKSRFSHRVLFCPPMNKLEVHPGATSTLGMFMSHTYAWRPVPRHVSLPALTHHHILSHTTTQHPMAGQSSFTQCNHNITRRLQG